MMTQQAVRPTTGTSTQGGGNPFRGRQLGSSSDPTELLHPQGSILGFIEHARIYNAQSSGRLTLELGVRTDWHVENGRESYVYRHFVFDGDGAQYTQEFLDSLDIDMGAFSDQTWKRELLDAVMGRRVEVGVYHRSLAGRVQVQTRYCLGTEETREQERLIEESRMGIEPTTDGEGPEPDTDEVAA